MLFELLNEYEITVKLHYKIYINKNINYTT